MIVKKKKVQRRTAKTTEDRVWEFIAEQAKVLHGVASNPDWPHTKKRMIAGDPYQKIKNALRHLGVI